MVAVVVGEFTFLLIGFVDELLYLLSNPIDELTAYVANGSGALGHPKRRKILRILEEQEEGVLNRDEIADEHPSPEQLERVVTTLHRHHFPKLDDRGYLDYDLRSGDAALWIDPQILQSEFESTD